MRSFRASRQKRLRGFGFDEAERHRFGESCRSQHAAHELIAGNPRVGRRCRLRDDREGRLELVEAEMTPDLFDEVDLTQQIDAVGWRDRIPTVARRRHLQPQPAQDARHVGVRGAGADASAPAAEDNGRRWARSGARR